MTNRVLIWTQLVCRILHKDGQPMAEMLTTRELQELLCVDRKTIYRMLQEGELPAVRVGGQWRFSRQAINTWLAETASSPAPEPDLATAEVLPLDCFANVLQVF